MAEVVNNHRLYGDITVVKDDTSISYWIKKNMIWEENILKILCEHLKKRPGTFIDAGAFIGPHSIGVSKIIPGTKIVAFEPSKLAFSCLEENATRCYTPNSEIYNIALGNESGKGFMVYNGDGNPGGSGLKKEVHDNNTQMNEVNIRTLDSFNIDNVSVIKIDTEGQEDNVILGAANTIKKYKPVLVVEIQGGCTYSTATPEQKRAIEKTTALIQSLGYKVELIHAHDYLCTPL